MRFYNLKPVVYISYYRNSYYDKNNKNLRITFDTNLKYRLNNLDLSKNNGTNYFDKKMYIMEIKTLDSFPLWFVKILSELKIYPVSFSKYGNIYIKHILKECEIC